MLFPPDQSISVKAIYLGPRLNVRALDHLTSLDTSPLLVAVDGGGLAVVLRYGVVVLFGVAEDDEARFLNEVRPAVTPCFDDVESEEAVARIGPQDHGADGVFLLKGFDQERIQLVATVLAKSVVLAHYEKTVAATFDQIEPVAVALEQGTERRLKRASLLQLIGQALLVQTRTIGRSEVAEKPEILWEHPELEGLYERIHLEYELSERQVAIEQKLQVVSSTAGTVLDLLQYRRSHRVEWYIAWLIIIDIIISLVLTLR